VPYGAIYATVGADHPAHVVLEQPVRFRAVGVRKDWMYTDKAGDLQTTADGAYPNQADVGGDHKPYRTFDFAAVPHVRLCA
jgi:hypothetical protein